MIRNILMLLILSSITIWGQAETLVSGNIEHGGFGAPVIKFTQVNGKFGLLVGGRGGWILNHKFVLGAGAYGLVNQVETDFIFDEILIPLMMGYGGFEMEYIFSSNKLLHFSIYLLLGGGGVTYKNLYDWNTFHISDNFWVAEPAANIELNISSFFRITAGVGYRFITGVELGSLSNSDITGFEGILTFKFGKF